MIQDSNVGLSEEIIFANGFGYVIYVSLNTYSFNFGVSLVLLMTLTGAFASCELGKQKKGSIEKIVPSLL